MVTVFIGIIRIAFVQYIIYRQYTTITI